MFAGTGVYQIIKDSDYDALEDPIDREKLENLFFKKGRTAYKCLHCGRLLIEWEDGGMPLFYKPEEPLVCEPDERDGERLKFKEESEETHARMKSEGPPDPRLEALEAAAESAYEEMYDSSNPVRCYSCAKDAFLEAIIYAEQSGRSKDVARLEKRLQHVKNVFRHQFANY
jgi:hypothetical protein